MSNSEDEVKPAPPGGPPRPAGPAWVGPVIAATAAAFAAALVGGVAFVSREQRLSWQREAQETPSPAGAKEAEPAGAPAGRGDPPGPPHAFLPGLRARYFGPGGFGGPAFERVEAAIGLDPGRTPGDLPPVATGPGFAVRWEGRFLAEAPGEYRFLLSAEGRTRLLLDGEEVGTGTRGAVRPPGPVVLRCRLTPGWHGLLLEYSNDRPPARCVLHYVPPGAGAAAEPSAAGLAIPARLLSHPM